jgi:hypothetical protein
MSDKGQINVQQIGIGALLKQYRLLVPPNQREYSWTDKQVGKLLEDLAKAISDEEPEYFLGTIATIPRGPELLEVVDGQQRLATTAIFLSEIRNYLRDKDPLISDSIDRDFLIAIDRGKREHVPKLQLNIDDNEFFRSRITLKAIGDILPPARISHRLINAAFDRTRGQIKRIVAPYDTKDHGDVLNKWIEFIENKAQAILLKVPSDINAYTMFETMNDRGLRTSQADLVKNYLFGQAGQRLPEAQQAWTRLRGSLESLEEEDITVTFLRQAMIAIRGYLTAEKVYEAVQAKAKGPQTAIELLSELDRLSVSYVAMLNSESEKWNTYPEPMRRAVQTLDRLNMRILRPLMLAVASRFSPKEATDAFRTFISWSVRLLIASSTRSESVIEPIATAANKVFLGDLTNVAALKKNLVDLIPSDEQFKQAFETATVSKGVLARYYLRSLEMAAKREANPWFIPNDDKQVINLEHILPENPEENWENFSEENVIIYAKKLGNLALLQAKNNSDLKSAPFKMKKKTYAQSPYVLTSQIAKVSDWTPSQIVLRQRGLAELALVAWPL